MKIAVITSTLSERADLLQECRISVLNQTADCPIKHFVKIDENRAGSATVRNEVIKNLDASFDWLAFLDDDDLLLPDHFKILVDKAAFSDIIYSDCQTVGWDKTWVTKDFNLEEIKIRNYIPITALIRRSVFEKVGCFRSIFPDDWDLWKRCGEAKARFVYVPKVTWQYRRIANRQTMLTTGRIIL